MRRVNQGSTPRASLPRLPNSASRKGGEKKRKLEEGNCRLIFKMHLLLDHVPYFVGYMVEQLPHKLTTSVLRCLGGMLSF